MDDDERTSLARRTLDLIHKAEKLSVTKVQDQAKKTIEDSARDALLGAVGRIAGPGRPAPPTPPNPPHEEIDVTLFDMEAESARGFDHRLAAAAARAAQNEAAEAADLAAIRRSFPKASRDLAALIFASMELLNDVVERDVPPTAEQLERREVLLARVEALLRPRAGEALQSFVEHVIELSQERRRMRR